MSEDGEAICMSKALGMSGAFWLFGGFGIERRWMLTTNPNAELRQ